MQRMFIKNTDSIFGVVIVVVVVVTVILNLISIDELFLLQYKYIISLQL